MINCPTVNVKTKNLTLCDLFSHVIFMLAPDSVYITDK
ncbi:hypothetical protein A464_4601 [Salmonella bongori N268-08]|uniref:Uncharacterized protein n=1 Tax=Salmonella bongori N268-08 TaxID=1197719 RepID=S5N403_SALBN|nr:hypothetical protein A464_4601 [Salmonella bongori N268-08]